jgi:transposase
VRDRRTFVNFLRFMNDLVRAYGHRELHVVDNLNIHKNEAARRWLGRHKQVQFRYTPTHASWVNLIECFFSILSKQGLAHSVQHSKRDLKHLLHRFLASYNQTCNPIDLDQGSRTPATNHRDDQGVSDSSPQKASPAQSETEKA